MTRTKRILEILTTQPFASVRELQEKLDVSAATIRRDIDRLDGDSQARKVYGGIAALDSDASRSLSARPYFENLNVATDAKTAIATHAAKLVKDGERLIISPGTTCYLLGIMLAKRNISIYTNSMPLAGYLGEKGTCAYTVGGGEAHREPGLYHRTKHEPVPFYASRIFMSGQGFSSAGIMESHPLIVSVTNTLLSWVDEAVVLLDSRKFDLDARYLSIPTSRIDLIITDSGLSDKHANWMDSKGIKFDVAFEGSDEV